MIDDELVNSILNAAVTKANENMKKKGTIDLEDAIPLMLKSQFNHIKHLEMNMVTKDQFESLRREMKSELGSLGREMGGLRWMVGMIGIGIALLAILQGYIGFFHS